VNKILNFVLLLSMIFCICYSQEKTTIAVYNLRSTSILSQEEAEILTNHLRSILINFQKYNCLDRNRMDEILKEQGFQQSGCTNEMCAVEAGQLLGVQKMLSGSVGKFGKLFTIELQIIDIETSRIDKSSTYYFEGEMEQLLTEGIILSLEKLIGTKQEISSNKEKEQVEISHEPNIIKQESEFGHITFHIVPSDAKIVVENNIVPNQQIDDYKINAGTYDLKISKKGYIKYTDVISVEAGENLIIEKTLKLDEKPGNAYYFELLGRGSFFSIMHEWRISNNFGINTGIGYPSVQFGINRFYGKSKSRFEIGAYASYTFSDKLLWDNMLLLTVLIGYRYQQKNGLLFRIGLSPGIAFFPNELTIGMVPGISIGYSK